MSQYNMSRMIQMFGHVWQGGMSWPWIPKEYRSKPRDQDTHLTRQDVASAKRWSQCIDLSLISGPGSWKFRWSEIHLIIYIWGFPFMIFMGDPNSWMVFKGKFRLKFGWWLVVITPISGNPHIYIYVGCRVGCSMAKMVAGLTQWLHNPPTIPEVV